MATVNSIAGYYDLYDKTKGYTALLFRAGKVLQSKEVNEIQSVLKNQIKNVGDTILTNGDIIEGCQLVLKDDDPHKVMLTRGRIYLNGDVREVEDTEITIAAEGTEVIGAKIKQEIVTPDDDPDLLDVSTGFDNYNQDGAYRLKETVEITLNDSGAAILYNLVDGQQLSTVTTEDLTQLEKMNATLARRTFDESGNYKVSGLTLVDKQMVDDKNIYISLEPGKAYVKGYEVVKAVPTIVAVPRASVLRQIDNEPKTFRDGTDKYALNNNYIHSINKLVSIVESTQNITRGSIVGGIDYLPLSPVVEVVEVEQGATVYVEGTDFQLLNDGIDWSIGTKAPNPGSSYSVTWTYNKTMTKDVDYTLFVEDGSDIGYVRFVANGDKPVAGSTFLINYDFTLCRRDIVSLDENGKVILTQGQSDIMRTVESPAVGDDNVLVLGSTLVRPNSDEIVIINNDTKTIPMLDMYKMLERINALEYNQAITDLDNEAAEGENATELMGVFTDGFLGLSKSDTYHSEWTASIDLDNQELTLPFTTQVSSLNPNKKEGFNAGLFNRLLTAPYTEINLFSQPLATGNMRVNSYNAFPKRPSVKLQPEVDNWIDEKTITIEGGTKTTSVTLRRWWYHKNASWAQQEKALWQSYGFADGGASLGWNSATATTKKSVINSIVDTAIMYMRQNSVNVTIQNMPAYADNIIATFDGRAINLSPNEVKYQGTKAGSLKADNYGKAVGHFQIPAKTLCGSRQLVVYCENTPSLSGNATYTANGRTRTTTKTVWTEVVRLNPTDPLAQSFSFDTDQYLTGVGIYFKDKDTVEPITIELRNMVNGYPGTTVYAEKVIQPNQIKTSANAATELKVKFDDPVYCNANEQYCFTILSNSDVDSVWLAETTKADINTRQQVSKNPYLNGTLFSSSNALTWTAHQSMDLKFNLYGAKFETTGQVIFDTIANTDYDRLMIMSEESIPSGCSISWQYAINNGDWMPIETYDDRELDTLAESVKIRALITANTYTSPAIALDSLILCGFSNESSGVYVSKNVSVPDGFNTVKVVVDLHIPTGANFNVFFATDTNGINWQPLDNTATVQKSALYKTYTFEKELTASAQNYRVKIVLSTVDPTKRPKAQNLRSIMKTV